MEIFKSISGYEGIYEVSNLGTVRSIDRLIVSRRGSKEIREGRTLKVELHSRGYLRVMLSRFDVHKKVYIHRLVAETFIDNPLRKPQINHRNLNKKDNRVSNLEWCTLNENVKHYIDSRVLPRPTGGSI